MDIPLNLDGQELTIKCKRAFVFTGPVAEMPDWFQDMIVPKEKPLDEDEVWTGHAPRQSLTIRLAYGYLTVPVGSLIIQHHKGCWQYIDLNPREPWRAPRGSKK